MSDLFEEKLVRYHSMARVDLWSSIMRKGYDSGSSLPDE